MARVLAAARDADAAVEDCALEGQATLVRARATEKAIAAAAVRRAANVRAAVAARTERRLADLQALEHEATRHSEPEDEDLRRLEHALGQLAAELTTEAP